VNSSGASLGAGVWLGQGRHAPTLQQLAITLKLTGTHLAALANRYSLDVDLASIQRLAAALSTQGRINEKKTEWAGQGLKLEPNHKATRLAFSHSQRQMSMRPWALSSGANT
jgi:hypothetical protein